MLSEPEQTMIYRCAKMLLIYSWYLGQTEVLTYQTHSHMCFPTHTDLTLRAHVSVFIIAEGKLTAVEQQLEDSNVNK